MLVKLLIHQSPAMISHYNRLTEKRREGGGGGVVCETRPAVPFQGQIIFQYGGIWKSLGRNQ